MVKEYFPEQVAASNELVNYKYRNFKMEPNMVLDMQKEWLSFDNYMASMTSRYRSKIKSSLKKSAAIELRNLTWQEIEKYQSSINTLFAAVHGKAKYKLGTLNTAAFIDLKRNLKERFTLNAYFLDDKMVGFSSVFINNGALDANYVGLDYDYNKSHSVYQRILYDLVDMAINNQLQKLHFGRTASEIKSNFGAKAVDMVCYVKTKNSVTNKIIKPFVKKISTPDFVERNPFKNN